MEADLDGSALGDLPSDGDDGAVGDHLVAFVGDDGECDDRVEAAHGDAHSVHLAADQSE